MKNEGGYTKKQIIGGNITRLCLHFLMMCLVMTMLIWFQKPAQAASFSTKSKPKFTIDNCYYSGQNLTLTWKKVKGAKKYVVYQSKKKGGKYKKFATTKKTTITKAMKGDYYYKVKAFNGRKSGKYSKPVHMFSASGNIYNSQRLGTTIYIGGYAYRGSTTSYYYCLLQNYTKNTLTLTEGSTVNFYQFNPANRETKYLEAGSLETSTTIAGGKTGTFTLKAGYPTVETDTVLVAQVPFKAGGKTFNLYIARDAVNTWVAASEK